MEEPNLKIKIRRARLKDLNDIIKIWEAGIPGAFGKQDKGYENKEDLRVHFKNYLNYENEKFGFWVYFISADKPLVYCFVTPFHLSLLWKNKIFGYKLLKFVLEITSLTFLHYVFSTIVSDKRRTKRLGKKLAIRNMENFLIQKAASTFLTQF